MTIRDLWKYPLSLVKKARVSLSTLSGQGIVIDISIWLHEILKNDDIVYCLSLRPAYHPERLLRELEHRHKILTDAGLDPMYVFDGHYHPMKIVARKKCDVPVEEARKWLDDFHNKGRHGEPISDEERAQSMQRMKLHVHCG